MKKIKKGDIVGRISYGKDIIFIVDRIINLKSSTQIAILKGLTMRIKADSLLEDLEIIDKRVIKSNEQSVENRILSHLSKYANRLGKFYGFGRNNYGKVLHLDGDSRYSQKSVRYYRNMGISAVVKNVAENRQPFVVQNLLNRYKPDVLVITGHDGMIRRGTGFNDIYNYRNSAYFVRAVKQARLWENYSNNLAIFAGACQSYYEAIIEAGANFASSPARILIDFVDPLIVAENIAIADKHKFVSIRDFENDLRDGQRGISGIGVFGKSFGT
ncbi:MAG: sporulation peptidase YabG [Clostridia bacterium]|nr:sporulation peptidase YabG [Clostridia bacterium]